MLKIDLRISVMICAAQSPQVHAEEVSFYICCICIYANTACIVLHRYHVC